MFISFLSALEISATSGKQDGEGFSVLTLIDEDEFECYNVTDIHHRSISIECVVDKIPNQGFSGFENGFFSLSYKMIDEKFRLYIYPKYSQKLFGIAKDPRGDFTIDKDRPNMARIWQIIGYKKKIPFLAQTTQKRGLDFPVKVKSQAMPFIPELNADNTPLKETKNFDFLTYSDIEKLMKEKDYISALSEINEAIKASPNSVFRRDLTYNRIIAMSKLNLENKEAIINAALAWVKSYPADPDIPEILYILADAYEQENIPAESEYYHKRIVDEYAHTRFAPLSQMQIAKIHNKANQKVHARVAFQKAYEEAKDIQSASDIAIEWALFELQNNNPKSTQDIMLKVIEGYPEYFLQLESNTDKLLETLEDSELYSLTTKIIDYMAKNIEDEDKREPYAFALGEHYAKANDFDLAHQANMDYLKAYDDPKQPRYQIVVSRDDEILFNVKGDDNQKLEHYAHILSKYPNTPQAQKASDLISEILLSRQNYTKVLEHSNNDKYRQKAITALIKESISKNDCKNANIYLLQAKEYNLEKDEKKVAFDCLSDAGLHKISFNVARNMSRQAKDPQEKLDWLYREASNLYALGDYKKAILAARDGFNLAINQKSHQDIGFVLFWTLDALKSINEAKKLMPFLQHHFEQDYRILPVYERFIEYSLNDQDLVATQVYAQHLIDLQKKLKIYDFTPYVHFALANALSQSQKQNLAIKVLENLESSQEFNLLSPSDSQKLFYQIASLYNLQNSTDKALSYFDKCLKVSEQSAWKTLCKQARDMIIIQNIESKATDSSTSKSSDSTNPQNQAESTESNQDETSAQSDI